MTRQWRPSLLFSLLSLTIMAMALIAGLALHRTELRLAGIYHDGATAEHRLDLIEHLYGSTIDEAAKRFAEGNASLAETVPALIAARNQANELWLLFRDTKMSSLEHQLSEETEGAMRDIDLQIDGLNANLRATVTADPNTAASDDSIELVTMRLLPRIERYGDMLGYLSNQHRLTVHTNYEEAHQAFVWWLTIVLAAAALTIIGLGFLAFFAMRRAAQPLERALLAEAASLQRDMGIEANGTAPFPAAGNELSTVIETLQRFRRNLSDLTSLQQEQSRQANLFRAQLEAIFRHAPVGVYIKDLEGHMLVISDAAAKLWGRGREEMIGKLDTSWSKPDEAEIIRATNRRVLETGEPLTVEYRGQLPNTYDWMLTVKFPVRDEAGKIVSIGGFDIDISDSKRQIEELRLASAHLQNVKRLAHMFYWSRRVDSVTGANKSYHIDRAFYDLVGRDDVPDDSVEFARQTIHPEDRDRMIKIYSDFEEHKFDDYQVEYRLVRPDGETVHIRAWVERIRDSASRDFLIAGVVQDITQEKQREAQVMKAKAEAEASDKAKSEFLTNMSHELRTPLNAVIGYSDLLGMHDIVQNNGQLGGYVEAVNESGRNLLELINSILDMARLENSGHRLQEDVFPICEAINDISQHAHELAARKNITLQLPNIQPTEGGVGATGSTLDPALRIRAETRAFRQILRNVLSNAIKYTAADGRVSLSTLLRSNGDLAIEISDTGSGIDAKMIPLLTIPFAQSGSAWTRRKGGIGLGLAIAKKLMDLHQGKIEVDTKPQIGTSITLVFPAERVLGQTPPVAAIRPQPV